MDVLTVASVQQDDVGYYSGSDKKTHPAFVYTDLWNASRSEWSNVNAFRYGGASAPVDDDDDDDIPIEQPAARPPVVRQVSPPHTSPNSSPVCVTNDMFSSGGDGISAAGALHRRREYHFQETRMTDANLFARASTEHKLSALKEDDEELDAFMKCHAGIYRGRARRRHIHRTAITNQLARLRVCFIRDRKRDRYEHELKRTFGICDNYWDEWCIANRYSKGGTKRIAKPLGCSRANVDIPFEAYYDVTLEIIRTAKRAAECVLDDDGNYGDGMRSHAEIFNLSRESASLRWSLNFCAVPTCMRNKIYARGLCRQHYRHLLPERKERRRWQANQARHLEILAHADYSFLD